MIGKRIGGIKRLWRWIGAPEGRLLGGLGVSGDTSCTDHIIAWKLRHALNLDNVPAGVGESNTDNIIFAVEVSMGSSTPSASTARAVAVTWRSPTTCPRNNPRAPPVDLSRAPGFPPGARNFSPPHPRLAGRGKPFLDGSYVCDGAAL